MRLYDNPISGNCYKVRLFLALIGKEYESIPVDSVHGETRQPHFLAISPRGLIPVLEDQGERIADSMGPSPPMNCSTAPPRHGALKSWARRGI